MQKEHAFTLFSLLTLVIFLMKKKLERKFSLGHKDKDKFFKQIFFTNWIFIIFYNQKTKVRKEFFLWHLFFGKASFTIKKFKNWPSNYISFLFSTCISFICFTELFISFSNFFAINIWSTSTCFKKQLFHLFYNKKLILSLLVFLDLLQLLHFYDKVYNTWFVHF